MIHVLLTIILILTLMVIEAGVSEHQQSKKFPANGKMFHKNAVTSKSFFSPIVMNAATERKIVRWMHIVLSIPILGYIYGPVAEKPEAVVVVRFVIMPVVILSGFWMWKGHIVKKWFRSKLRP